MISRLALVLATVLGSVPIARAQSPAPKVKSVPFEDVTTASGVTFVHVEGPRPFYLPQAMGAGVAFTDLDGDGFADLLFVQGGGENDIYQGDNPPAVYYRNNGDGTFTDVTARSGLELKGIGMGIMVADFDCDGYPDLVATYYGKHPVGYHNMGDGTFRQFPLPQVGTRGTRPAWNTGMAAIDADADGFPDLFVLGYLDYPLSLVPSAATKIQIRGNWQPRSLSPFLYPPGVGAFWHNTGALSFVDQTTESNVRNPGGKGLAAVAFDADSDGRPDLFVANDVSACALYWNKGGRFDDASIPAWVADVRGSMGLAVGDYNHDGALDFFCSRWIQEYHGLYHNNRAPGNWKGDEKTLPSRVPHFTDMADAAGLESLGGGQVGWGTAFLDVDGDGWEDLIVFNGHTYLDKTGDRLIPLATVVMINDHKGHFDRLTGIPLLDRKLAARGAAFADFDNDGVMDCAIAQNRLPGLVWRGKRPGSHWVELDLVGTRRNRDALGARVEVKAGDLTLTREIVSGDSYLSANSPRLLFSTGVNQVDKITVRWPSGTVTHLTKPKVDAIHRMVEVL